MDPLDRFSRLLRPKLTHFRSAKLIRESIGTEVDRVTFSEFNFCIGEVGLVFKDTTPDREFVTLNLIQHSVLHNVQWPVSTRVFHLSGLCINLTKRDIHTVLCG